MTLQETYRSSPVPENEGFVLCGTHKIPKFPPQGEFLRIIVFHKYQYFILRHWFVSISLPVEGGGGHGGYILYKNTPIRYEFREKTTTAQSR